MGFFRLTYRASVEKDIRSIPREFTDAIATRIDSLAQNPFPIGYKKLAGKEAYRIRVGNYRIVYTVRMDNKAVIIEKIKHRKDIYRK